MTTTPRTAIGYIRVSTEGQATEGQSLADQRERVEAYAKAHGYQLAGIEADEGLSAKTTDRPGLQRALRQVCRERGVLIVVKLDRLARSTRDAISLVEQIDGCGADLASITEQIDTATAQGRFVYRLFASLGELEREQIAERTRAALAFRKAHGMLLGSARPGHWDGREDRRQAGAAAGSAAAAAARRAERAPVYAEAGPIAAELRAAGSSLRAIAAELNARGITTPRGAEWRAAQVQRLIAAA